MTPKGSISDARLSTLLFLMAQIVPPALMFWLVFGHWGIGVSMIIGIPMLYSAVRIPLLFYRKQFHLLLRPTLTLMLSLIIVGMGNYYANEATRYVDQLAREMQNQCNLDGTCKLPPGEWTPSESYPTLFQTRTKGLVPIGIVLTFNEYEPNKELPCTKETSQPKCANGKSQKPLRFTAFHLMRLVADHHHDVYGGVGRSLNIPGPSEDE